MDLNLISFETLISALKQRLSIDESLLKITDNIEKEFEFSSYGVFIKGSNTDIFNFASGSKLSDSFIQNTFYTLGDPLIEELLSFEMLELRYPGRYLFERDYSHLLICPLFHEKNLLGFTFIDKEENFFDKSEVTKFSIFSSLMSMVIANISLSQEINQYKDFYKTRRIFSKEEFINRSSTIYQLAQRYKRELSIAIMKFSVHKGFLHAIGQHKSDEFIDNLSEILTSDIRSCDIVGKFENNSIAILLPETNTKQGLITIKRLDEKIIAFPHIKPSYLNWGLASKKTDTSDLENLLNNAIEAAEKSQKDKKTRISLN